MQTVEAHLADILALSGATPVVTRSLSDCLGLTLAEDVQAVLPVPPFTNSAMDGFAVIATDIAGATGNAPVTLEVVDDVPAGVASAREVTPGTAIRIMTGAPVPAGADTVVPVEETDQAPGPAALPPTITVRTALAKGRHVRTAGEDVAAGDTVLEAGTVINPAAVAAAASIGLGALPVHRRPRIAILATGDELVAAGETLKPGQIPDSNSLMLAGLAQAAGAEIWGRRSVGDDVTEFGRALTEALGADLVVTSGGVSAGAFDVVKEFGGGLRFAQVAMQPGKPQGFGLLAAKDGRQVPVLNLPGNPVSVFVSFHLFVVPLLAKLAGTEATAPVHTAVAAAGWKSPPGRRQYTPVAFTEHEGKFAVVPVHRLGSGSHLIASLHKADGLAVVGEDVTEVTAGTELDVIIL